jgi:transketolase
VSSTSRLSSVERCRRYRRRILEISQKVTAHVAPAFSCMEIVDVIYNELMRPQDVFVLSKGHGCLAQYVVLEDLHGMKLEEFCNGALGGHPDRGGHIAASTGSLGHGLGMAVGMAYAEYLKGSDTNVYVVMSDGELQEGSTWEAVQMAAKLKLDNLLLFVDANDYGGLERIPETLYPIAEGFEAFFWDSGRTNGHDAEAMKVALRKRTGGPYVLVCETVKGKGASFMVDAPIWHYKSPNKEEYQKALEELSKRGFSPHWT